MKCGECGAENQNGSFCEECGAKLDNSDQKKENNDQENINKKQKKKEQKQKENTNQREISDENTENTENDRNTDNADNLEKDENVKEALNNLKIYEEGTITDPKDKAPKKRKFHCPQNPMLWSFGWLFLFGAVLTGLTFVFFNTDLSGTQLFFGISFAVFSAVVLAIDFIYYFPAALQLDKLLKGKGVRLEYGLKKYELIDLAERAKSRNRGFYLAIGLFGLAFTVYYIYILATASIQTTLMWVSLIFSFCVFAIFAVLFFLMPKFNYDRMLENGSRVIVGDKSVYYGGNYYHWRKVAPDATFANFNTKKHILEITFVQDFKSGKSQKRRVEMYAPDTAIKDINKLLAEYEKNNKKYREKKEQMSIVDGKPIK